MAPPHPLRRISTGSLSSLARSQDRAHISPSGLDFLQPALTELADEAATLASNIANLNELHDALGTFNENFAAWMYALKMNAFCVEWPLAPDENTFQRAAQLSALVQEEESLPTRSTSSPSGPSRSTAPTHIADQTYATVYSSAAEDAAPKKPLVSKRVISGSNPAAKKAAMERKRKRELEINGIIDMLPLEFRGSDPTQRTIMEKVINKLMDRSQGYTIKDMVSADLPQIKVNKCLIALVGRKLVQKGNMSGATWYKWVGV